MDTAQTAVPVLPPGPQKNLLFDREADLKHNVIGILQKGANEYNGISRHKIGIGNFIHITNPSYIEHVFTRGDIYIKSNENKELKFLLGNGLLTSEGTFWLKQRRLIQPLFHKQRLTGFVQKITETCNALIAEWNSAGDGVKDVHAEMTKLTLGIVSKTLLSTDASADFRKISHALEILMKVLGQRSVSVFKLPYWVPLPKHIRMKNERQLLDNTIEKIIGTRRADTKQYDNLLTMLMEVEDADTAERMTNVQLRDEVITIFLAGHETTANGMAFALYHLAKHPGMSERIAHEVEAVFKDGPFTYDGLMQLDFTTRVIKESMRLFPPAWIMARLATKDDIIDGYIIKKNDVLVMSPYTVQRLNRVWPNAEHFDPDRFLPENMKHMPRYAYFPFGGGARMCIGNNFAMMEMQIMLALLASHFQFKLVPSFNLQIEPLVTLRPKGGLKLEVHKIQS
jgi:cytochrome P450